MQQTLNNTDASSHPEQETLEEKLSRFNHEKHGAEVMQADSIGAENFEVLSFEKLSSI